MVEYTDNLGLAKPSSRDKINIAQINNNFEILDKAQIVKRYTGTLNVTGYKQVISISASDYVANNRSAHLKLRFKCWSTTNVHVRHEFVAEVIFSGANPEFYIVNSTSNAAANTNSGIYKFRILAPKSDSYGPSVDIGGYDTAVRQFSMDVLECDIPYTVDTTPNVDVYNSSRYNYAQCDPGRYNYLFSSNAHTGDFTGRGGSSWDSLFNDRFKAGEALVAANLVAVASDGLLYKVITKKAYKLPMSMGRCTGTFAANATYAQYGWSIRGINVSELTGSANGFTLPKLAIGDYLYFRGRLDGNGNFVPDGIITTSPTAGYTSVLFGRMDHDTTHFSVIGHMTRAYTLDSNGKLTHIDGLQIA